MRLLVGTPHMGAESLLIFIIITITFVLLLTIEHVSANLCYRQIRDVQVSELLPVSVAVWSNSN